MRNIQFSIGPSDSQMHVVGDYNKAYESLGNKKGISMEHWED